MILPSLRTSYLANVDVTRFSSTNSRMNSSKLWRARLCVSRWAAKRGGGGGGRTPNAPQLPRAIRVVRAHERAEALRGQAVAHPLQGGVQLAHLHRPGLVRVVGVEAGLPVRQVLPARPHKRRRQQTSACRDARVRRPHTTAERTPAR